MLEDITVEEQVVQRRIPRNAIGYYFEKARDLELSDGYLVFLDEDARAFHTTMLQQAYDILFDRIMTTRVSPYLKQEMEQWYGFNRDFLGFCDTAEMNRELEDMLERFELL